MTRPSNDEITNFNRKLLKLKKLFPQLSLVEINENRHLYTKHGLHLNDLGKEILSFNTVLQIFSLIEKQNNHSTNIIVVGYHEVQSRTISHSVNQLFPLTPVETVENTSVKRIRKKPVKKRMIFMGNLNLSTKCYNTSNSTVIHSTDLNKGSKSPIIHHPLKIYHQNICGLRYKINELLGFLYPPTSQNTTHEYCMELSLNL
jgi:hypothetical protein